jgi:hypothetical protein
MRSGATTSAGRAKKNWGSCWEGLGGYASGLRSRDRYTRLNLCPTSAILPEQIVQRFKMKDSLRFLTAFAIVSTGLLTTQEQAKAESTYNASCKALGDAITLTSTGELVLEQRLVQFKPIETYKAQSGQRGVCIIKKDPPGYRWISCWKKDGGYVTGDWDYARRVSPKEVIANAVQHRGWSGACKVRL